jgi:hypothetical protein
MDDSQSKKQSPSTVHEGGIDHTLDDDLGEEHLLSEPQVEAHGKDVLRTNPDDPEEGRREATERSQEP